MVAVDVVILSLNREELIKETINNIVQQKNVVANLWIVDQGSRPEVIANLRSLSERHNNSHLIELAENVGVPGGRNIGMRPGSAKYIVSIDNDAVFSDDSALEEIISHFEACPELGALGFRVKNFYTLEDDLMTWVYPKSLLPHSDKAFRTACYSGCAHALRRDVLEQTDWYEDNLFFNWEERDLSYQIINLGFEIEYYPQIVVFHKVSPDARRTWNNDRFYYLARNAVYIHHKYFRTPYTFLILLGYFLKGLYNRVPRQALRACYDALKMMFRTRDRSTILTEKAREYIYEHEFKYRGSIWARFRREVLQRLPQ